MENIDLLNALKFDAEGDWEAAHEIAQSNEGNYLYDRLHAYLHRKEGDKFNANYWYQRCKIKYPNCSLSEEWQILKELYK
jgi:hypothetical protein